MLDRRGCCCCCCWLQAFIRAKARVQTLGQYWVMLSRLRLGCRPPPQTHIYVSLPSPGIPGANARVSPLPLHNEDSVRRSLTLLCSGRQRVSCSDLFSGEQLALSHIDIGVLDRGDRQTPLSSFRESSEGPLIPALSELYPSYR